MIFVWGTKEKRKPFGHVADLCVACGEIRAHRFIQVREVPHIYYLPIGPGKIAQYQIECGACDLASVIEPSRYAARLDQQIELGKLIELTHPGVHAQIEEAKDREERARRGDLTSEERIQVMIESLYTVTMAVDARVESGAIDGRVPLMAVAMVTLPWLLIVPGVAAQSAFGEILTWAGVGVGVLGLVATVHASQTSIRRFIQRTQGDAILDALREFNPSPTELHAIVDGQRAAGTHFGKKLDVTWLNDLFISGPAVSRVKPIG